MHSIDRRTLIRGAAGAAALTQLPGALRTAWAADEPVAGDVIAGKSARMIVHNAKIGVMETPLELLREQRLTPKEIVYNRTHFPVTGDGKWVATLAVPRPEDVQNWTIEIGGMVQRPKKIRVADLQKMQRVTRTSVMQCAGNGRSYYWAKAKTPGSGWKHGGMANLQWEGVPLLPLLESLDLSPDASVRYVTANGKDRPPVEGGADMIKSVPMAAPQMKDAILALRMNGEDIPTIHGGPVRLIVPGYYGNMCVKWVTDLALTPEETPSALMQKTYRMPIMQVEPGKFTAQDLTQRNSDPTYGFRVMSVVFAPLAGETVRGGNVELRGVAFNDGVVPLAEIRVSLDQGRTWIDTDFEAPDGPYGWVRWQRRLRLPTGKHEVWVRAVDGWGRSQPLDGLTTWNPGGWCWHGVDRVAFAVA